MTKSTRATGHAKTSASRPATPAITKSATVLSRPEGASLAEMIEATGWQQHSVRGFLAGTVRKKPGLELITGDVRTWRTVAAGTAQ